MSGPAIRYPGSGVTDPVTTDHQPLEAVLKVLVEELSLLLAGHARRTVVVPIAERSPIA